jgi:hypothetical protein
VPVLSLWGLAASAIATEGASAIDAAPEGAPPGSYEVERVG